MADQYKVGDVVITQSPLWWRGENIGERLGRVISIEGHILVELYDYKNNPVKCFRDEIRKANMNKRELDEIDWSDVLDKDDY